MKKVNKDFIRKIVVESMNQIRIQEQEPKTEPATASSKDVENFVALMGRLPNSETAAARIDKPDELAAVLDGFLNLLTAKGIEDQELKVVVKDLYRKVMGSD